MSKSTPRTLQLLRQLLGVRRHSQILQHYLGATTLGSGSSAELSQLFNNAVLVTVHLNRMAVSPFKLQELGIATFDARKLDKRDGPGPHAQHYLSQACFMHFRLREHAHLPAQAGNPDAYHFGTSVFTSQDEAREFLGDVWHQPMDEEDPELGFRPVICLHYGNDVFGLAWYDFGFEPAKMDTTVAVLDGQSIVEQAKVTRNPFAPIEYVLGVFHIPPFDSGNSGNAAAYITISALLSALRTILYTSPKNPKAKPGKYGKSASKTAQAVMQWLMERPTPAPPVGTETYCYRCGMWAHYFSECPNSDFICNRCSNSTTPWRRENAATHKEGLCIFRC